MVRRSGLCSRVGRRPHAIVRDENQVQATQPADFRHGLSHPVPGAAPGPRHSPPARCRTACGRLGGRYALDMPRLVLVNGAPGAGKSTIAQALAGDRELTLALDVDAIKHSLGRWDADPTASGLHARRLALALAERHLRAGYDVIVGQYLAHTPFIEDLEALADSCDARWYEFVLDLDASTLADRLGSRADAPTRAEHAVNDRWVAPTDADRFVESVEALRESRPEAIWLDARGTLSATLELLRAALPGWAIVRG
jgi:predicted kinase